MRGLDKDDILFNKKISQRLKDLREKEHPIQAQFAKEHHLDRQILSRWENPNDKRGISIHTIRRFCGLIDISLKDFFDDKLFK